MAFALKGKMQMTNDQKAVAIGASGGIATMVVTLVALSSLLPGMSADATAGQRLAFAVQWIALAALPLALAIGSVGNARFSSEAINPLAGKESPETAINCRVVDNNVQQYLLFGAATLAVASGSRGDQLGVVAAAAIVFVIARLVFWIGYRIRPVYRAAGFASTFYLNLGLFGYALWLTWRP
jgi:uncharacterized MAPEG superfamily protein